MLKKASFIFSIVIILITLLPFILKTLHAPPNTYFPLLPNGIILQDYYSDLASIRQGSTIFKEIAPYTTEDVKPEYLHLYYLIAGKIGGMFNLSPIQIYYICTYSTLIALFIFIYLLVSMLVPKSYQLFSLFIIYFSGPFPQGDAWWTNQNVYNRFLMRPHHLTGVTILLALAYFFIKFYRKPSVLNFVICGILSFFGLLFSGTPQIIFLAVISIFFVISFFMFLKTRLLVYKNRFLGILAIIIISLPALVFLFYQISTSFYGTIIGNWEFTTFQKEIYPYTIGVYLISLGLLPLFALFSAPYILKKRSFEPSFIFLLFLAPLCFYLLSVLGFLHINKMRFMYSAPYVFGGILATFGVMRFKKIILGLITILFVINSLLSLKSYWLTGLFKKDVYYYNVYIPKNYFGIFEYINSSLTQYSKVMTSFATGNFIPAFTNVKVFVGNEVSTMNFHLKYQISQNVYGQKYSLAEVTDIFQKYNIQYLLWENAAPPNKYLPILKNLFQKDNVVLYKIM